MADSAHDYLRLLEVICPIPLLPPLAPDPDQAGQHTPQGSLPRHRHLDPTPSPHNREARSTRLPDPLGDSFIGGLVFDAGACNYTCDDRLHSLPIDRLWREAADADT